MLLNFVLSAQSTKYTKWNRVRKLLRLRQSKIQAKVNLRQSWSSLHWAVCMPLRDSSLLPSEKKWQKKVEQCVLAGENSICKASAESFECTMRTLGKRHAEKFIKTATADISCGCFYPDVFNLDSFFYPSFCRRLGRGGGGVIRTWVLKQQFKFAYFVGKRGKEIIWWPKMKNAVCTYYMHIPPPPPHTHSGGWGFTVANEPPSQFYISFQNHVYSMLKFAITFFLHASQWLHHASTCAHSKLTRSRNHSREGKSVRINS